MTPNGAKRKSPAWRSSNAPNTLGESKRGTHSQSMLPSGATSAPVWQSDRKPYSAIGGNGEGIAALCGRGTSSTLPASLTPRPEGRHGRGGGECRRPPDPRVPVPPLGSRVAPAYRRPRETSVRIDPARRNVQRMACRLSLDGQEPITAPVRPDHSTDRDASQAPPASESDTSTPPGADVFDPGREDRLDADRLERALQALLSAYPDAPVAALSSAGIFVDMPQSLNLKQNPTLTGRSGLDGVEGTERERLVANWDRILTSGAGRCVFQPNRLPDSGDAVRPRPARASRRDPDPARRSRREPAPDAGERDADRLDPALRERAQERAQRDHAHRRGDQPDPRLERRGDGGPPLAGVRPSRRPRRWPSTTGCRCSRTRARPGGYASACATRTDAGPGSR